MLAALTLANRLTDKRDRLAEASGRLDTLRITVRLAKRLGFLSNPGYESITETRRRGGANARRLAEIRARSRAASGAAGGRGARGGSGAARTPAGPGRHGPGTPQGRRPLHDAKPPGRTLSERQARPKPKLETYVARLGQAGREVHVE